MSTFIVVLKNFGISTAALSPEAIREQVIRGLTIDLRDSDNPKNYLDDHENVQVFKI